METDGFISRDPTKQSSTSCFITATRLGFILYQYGVPTKELAGATMEAEPKSPSLTCPGSVSKMFPAFTSLWEDNRY